MNELEALLFVKNLAGGGGGSGDYASLTHKPQINGVTLVGNKTTQDLHILASGNEVFTTLQAAVTAINAWAADHRGVGDNVYIVITDVPDLWISGIEETSVPYVYTTDEAIINALKTDGYVQFGYYKLSALETQKAEVPDIQIDGTSIIASGVANIPKASDSVLGVVRTNSSTYGIAVNADGKLYIVAPSDADITSKSSSTKPITCSKLDKAIEVGVKTAPEYKSYTVEMSDGTTKTLKLYNELI